MAWVGWSTGLVVLAGCAASPPSATKPRAVSFANDIQPIFASWCQGCHSSGGSAERAGVPLQLLDGVAYDGLVGMPSALDPTRTLVIPGDADNSLLIQKAEDRAPVGGRMPPFFFPALSDSDRMLLRDWVEQGAADN